MIKIIPSSSARLKVLLFLTESESLTNNSVVETTEKTKRGGEKMLKDSLVCLLIETGGEEETGSASDWSHPDFLLTSQGGLLLDSLLTLLISSLTCEF